MSLPAEPPPPLHHTAAGQRADADAAAAWRVGAAAFVTAILVFLLFWALTAFPFMPLRDLVALEHRAYAAMFPPPRDVGPDFRPVVFIDIDNNALDAWNHDKANHRADMFESCDGQDAPVPTRRVREAASVDPSQAPDGSEGTPRSLIAALTRMARMAGAGAVFLDFDMRTPVPAEDAALRAELRCSRPSKVVLPRFYTTDSLPLCGSDQPLKETRSAIEPPPTSDVALLSSIALGHVVIFTGGYGMVENLCTQYKVTGPGTAEPVTRRAAMMRALELAGSAPYRLNHADDPPGPLHLRWWISKDTQAISRSSTEHSDGASPPQARMYSRVKASFLIRDGAINTSNIDLAALQHAVVIIGATHDGAGDVHLTPLGHMPGALIHANAAIELQMPHKHEVPWWLFFGAEITAILLCSVGFGLLYYYFNWRIRRKVFAGKVVLHLAELAIMLVSGLVLFAIIVGLESAFSFSIAGWRFGILLFVISALAAFCVELIMWAAEAFEHSCFVLCMSGHAKTPTSSIWLLRRCRLCRCTLQEVRALFLGRTPCRAEAPHPLPADPSLPPGREESPP